MVWYGNSPHVEEVALFIWEQNRINGKYGGKPTPWKNISNIRLGSGSIIVCKHLLGRESKADLIGRNVELRTLQFEGKEVKQNEGFTFEHLDETENTTRGNII